MLWSCNLKSELLWDLVLFGCLLIVSSYLGFIFRTPVGLGLKDVPPKICICSHQELWGTASVDKWIWDYFLGRGFQEQD